MPNTDNNYTQIGYLFAKIMYPFDFISMEWAIEHYLETKILPMLQEKNIYKTDIKDNIKIHNFKIQEMVKPEVSYHILQGDVYLYNIDKLNKAIDNKVFNKVPDVLGNKIKDYMGVEHEYSGIPV